jgi:hypothetical protein
MFSSGVELEHSALILMQVLKENEKGKMTVPFADTISATKSVATAIPHNDKELFFMSAVKYWAVFSIGVAAGAAVALIYAPQSGIRTRRQLRRGLEDAGDYIKNTAETIGGHAEKYVQRGKDIAENVRDTASTAYSAARKVVPI